MTFDPKIKNFPYNPKIRPANPSNKKLNWSGLMQTLAVSKGLKVPCPLHDS